MQNDFSVQFDELFKKAWEEDMTEYVEDGLYNLHADIMFHVLLCVKYDLMYTDLIISFAC